MGTAAAAAGGRWNAPLRGVAAVGVTPPLLVDVSDDHAGTGGRFGLGDTASATFLAGCGLCCCSWVIGVGAQSADCYVQ